MDEVELRIPRLRYDITMPLIDGRVKVDGVRLNVGEDRGGTGLTADSPLKTGDFGLAEMNVATFLPAIAAGWEVVGLPIFSKRKPVFTYLFVRSQAKIEKPKNLEGKRIGGARAFSGTSLWLRGLLHEHYGVDLSTVTWVGSARDELFPLYQDPGKMEEQADRKKRPHDLLLEGTVDAILGDISDGNTFDMLESNPDVKRLFPDYVAEDLKLYQETGIYTPIHVIVMSKTLAQRHPELALSIYAAFETAKQIAYDDILDDRAGFSVVYLRERLKEQMAEWGDPFKYGVAANKGTIDAFMRYSHVQGLIPNLLGYESTFAASSLET